VSSVSNPLSGKVVIVTGASSGIGRATARTLAVAGAEVVLAARSRAPLEALAQELGPRTVAVTCDVTSGRDVADLVERAVEHFGRIDVLFANAGVYIPGPAQEGDPDAWAHLVDVNVTGVMRCVRAVLPHMIARGSGDVVVTSSISGHQAIPWEPVYSASKHAVQAFVHGVRRQVAPHGVRVGSIAPGMVANELWGEMDAERIDRHVRERSALRSEDVADIVLFMLTRPPHVAIRDLVVLPHAQDL